MNQKGIDALVNAGLKGIKQIKHRLYDGDGGYCAMGILIYQSEIMYIPQNGFLMPVGTNRNEQEVFKLDGSRSGKFTCTCGHDYWEGNWEPGTEHVFHERSYIVHLNNDHDMDFVGIARKLESYMEVEENK